MFTVLSFEKILLTDLKIHWEIPFLSKWISKQSTGCVTNTNTVNMFFRIKC